MAAKSFVMTSEIFKVVPQETIQSDMGFLIHIRVFLSSLSRLRGTYVRDLWVSLFYPGMNSNRIHQRPTKFLRRLY